MIEQIEQHLITSRFKVAKTEGCSLQTYVSSGGYHILRRCIEDELEPETVIDVVEVSGLRGRGGAGYRTGTKWRSVFRSAKEFDDDESATEGRCYIIANGDEGDPGAFMNRALMEQDPHSIIEGMAIAGFCLGARKGFLFTRAEYARAADRFEVAVAEAEKAGYLGTNIMGTGSSFRIMVVRSGGGYLCGESTALVAALENHVGIPRPKPPHLSDNGLWGRPTLVNNVETFANIPLILDQGAEWFRSFGTPKSPGTKLFCITGAGEQSGLIEVELGIPAKEVLKRFLPNGIKNCRALQIGGPSGVIIPADIDMCLDYDSLTAENGVMGSGGIVVLGESDCIVETVRYFIDFSRRQSCGRCASCKHGLHEAVQILNNIVSGKGQLQDIENLERLAKEIPEGSLCGMGRSSTRPLQSALKFFRQEFVEHIEKQCHALVCKDMIRLEIDKQKCHGERCCLQTCPGNAIKGKFGKPGSIDQHLCLRCRACIEVCPYGAIKIVSKPSANEKD